MSLPSEDVLQDINELIKEITGFQDHDDNFAICQRYCLSHLMHHTYPFVNRSTVKNLMNSYVSRFYGHGYFKVSQELEHQVKSFLSHASLFEKNPQYDIQWCLLSLLASLSTNLTHVKHAFKLLPVDVEEIANDDINWHEYLKKDLPLPQSLNADDCASISADEDENDDDKENVNFISSDKKKNKEVTESNLCLKNDEKPFHLKSGSDIQNLCQTKESEYTLYNNSQMENEEATIYRKNQIQEIIKSRLSALSIANDYKKWGNISEKFDLLLYKEGFSKKSQFISELEMMEYILYQFQTGKKIFLEKGLSHPALLSVTEKTIKNYLDSLQPYFQIIRHFKSFINDTKIAKYPELYESNNNNNNSNQSLFYDRKCFLSPLIRKNNISRVLYKYSLMLSKALDPFEEHIMNIMDNISDYTLIKMQHDIQSYFFQLTSLCYVHGFATKNWKTDSNWVCSTRVLAVLYYAIVNSPTSKMSFLYFNMFLQCFQVFLDIIDAWVSFLTLNDPTNEFIITISNANTISNSFCTALEIRPYKAELEKAGIKDVPVFNFISEEMSQIGASLDVLKRLNRFVSEDSIPKTSSYNNLLNIISSKIEDLIKANLPCPDVKIREKKKSIFTMCNLNLLAKEDDGKGDCSSVNIGQEDAKKTDKFLEEKKKNKCHDHCSDLINSTIKNVYFKKAFENIGLEYQLKRLKSAKDKKDKNEDGLSPDLIKKACDYKQGVYPYHKIILESCSEVISERISFASELVKNIILNEFHLKSHFSFLKSLLLFNDSYLIQSFLVEFFTQPTLWISSYSITLHLRECLEVRYKEQTPYLSVFIQSSSAFPESILEAIDALTINYEVEWPLTLIFTPPVITMYNKIFRLAIKLKWAHWILSNLPFHDAEVKYTAKPKRMHHRLQLIRFWFLSSLGLLKNYFMAQMGLPDPDFDSCSNLKKIIEAHLDFINKIHSNCLFNHETSEAQSFIFDTFISLCVDLVKTWKIENVAEDKLMSIENTFANCQFHLSRILSSLEKINGYSMSQFK